MQTSAENSNNLMVIAITQDDALIWGDGIGNEDLPVHLRPPVEVDHRHVRTGQNHHGHDTEHRFPEYFESIADRMRKEAVVLVIGHGHGKAAKANQFLNYLERKHPNLRKRVVDLITLDLPALTESEIKSHARQWFEKNFRKLATWHDRQPENWFKSL
jgi:hypothetical protein